MYPWIYISIVNADTIAMKGVRKWEKMSHKKRVAAKKAKPHNWGFDGKSPRTRKRKYKGKR